jgi:hypothetical protein
VCAVRARGGKVIVYRWRSESRVEVPQPTLAHSHRGDDGTPRTRLTHPPRPPLSLSPGRVHSTVVVVVVVVAVLFGGGGVLAGTSVKFVKAAGW